MAASTSDPIAAVRARFAGKRCLVTGGSRGLGRALCVQLAREGADVAFTYCHQTTDADEAKSAIAAVANGREPVVFQGSVADEAHAKAVVDELVDRWGGLDVLVCAAGVMQVLPLALIEADDWDTVMNVNAKGAFLFARAAARPMIRQRRGAMLFVGNFASERVIEAPVHFAAAKSALRGMTEALARELGRYGVRVNLLAPGLLEAGISRMLPQHRVDEYLSMAPAGRLGRYEEIAGVAAFLCSDDAAFVSAAKVAVDGGL